jgi:hypothetical protein
MKHYPHPLFGKPGTGTNNPLLDPSLRKKEFSWWKRALLTWYAYTAPTYPGPQTSLQQQEAFRKGRLASLSLLLLIFVVVLFMASISITANINQSVFVSSSIGICLLVFSAGILNRRGYLTAATLIMIAILDGGIATTAITVKGGLGLVNLPLFDLMIASELIAVSLLAPFSVFIVGLFNGCFIILDVLLERHAPDLSHYLALSGWAVIIARPLLLQTVVAIVTFLWVDSALKALKRADRAETLAAMEHAIAEYERSDAIQKRQLEQGIQFLMETQRRVANGDFTARVPTTQDNALWPVAISFNNLLTRFQRFQQDANEIEHIRQEMPRVLYAIRDAKQKKQPIVLERTGTALDALILELKS